MKNINEQIKIITKGAAEVIEQKELEEKLNKAYEEGRQLIIKLGLDPTAPDLHLGHTVVLRKVRQLQDLGHKAVIILGDYTGMIGDPTGKSKTRKQLTKEEVMENAETYKQQLFKVLDTEKTEIRFNGEWLSKLEFKEVIELASKYTVTRMLEREDFKNRFEQHLSISIHEFLYPLVQGYDSVAIKADIELGGTDQKFNILMGRTLQKEFGQEKQIALLMPLLEGIDGVQKMSKSLGNYIGIDEEPENMYGKAMSIPDEMIVKYFELATDIHPDELEEMRKAMKECRVNPRDLKMKLARELVRLYHGEAAAEAAEEHFIRVFQQKLLPDEIEELIISSDDIDRQDIVSIVAANSGKSKSEVRRLIEQGGIKINGEKVFDAGYAKLRDGDIIQAGKRSFMKIVIYYNIAFGC
ncbi:MAG: tyrosine--tRNA ligase [Bacillota bacterium]